MERPGSQAAVSFGLRSLFESLVIPAKAGIQSVVVAFPMACRVDSRLRGNDGTAERPCPANDTTTPQSSAGTVSRNGGFTTPHGEVNSPLRHTLGLHTRPEWGIIGRKA